MKWIYHIEDRRKPCSEDFKVFGEHGWELVTVTVDRNYEHISYWKKPAPDEA